MYMVETKRGMQQYRQGGREAKVVQLATTKAAQQGESNYCATKVGEHGTRKLCRDSSKKI